MSKLHNLEAIRASYAFECAEEGNEKQKKTPNKFNYSAAVQELPTMLRMNGLRATMAYYYSKEGGQHRLVFEQIRDWYRSDNDPTKFMVEKFKAHSSDKLEKVFMKILLDLTDDEYRIVQAETLTLANWMIRFVKEDSNSKPDGEGQS